MLKLLVLADDFKGAVDVGAKLASRSLKTVMTTRMDVSIAEAASCDILVVNLDCRQDTPADALWKTKAILQRFEKTARSVYLKVDSALRGNVSAMMAGTLQVLNRPVVFVPAYPGRNRITRGGMQYIDGELLENTPFGVHRQSRVADICRRDFSIPVHEFSAFPHNLSDIAMEPSVLVFDCINNAAMENIASFAYRSQMLRVTAGCTGLAELFSRFPGFLEEQAATLPERPVFGKGGAILCGSASQNTFLQLDYGEQMGLTLTKIPPELLLSDEAQAVAPFLSQSAALSRSGLPVFVTARTPEDVEAAFREGEKRGLTREQVQQRIPRFLQKLAQALADTGELGFLSVLGGDSTAAVIQQLGCDRFVLKGELEDNVPKMITRIGEQDIRLLTRSRETGSKELLCSIDQLYREVAGK